MSVESRTRAFIISLPIFRRMRVGAISVSRGRERGLAERIVLTINLNTGEMQAEGRLLSIYLLVGRNVTGALGHVFQPTPA